MSNIKGPEPAGTVIYTKNDFLLKQIRARICISSRKRKLLEDFGWYRNFAGGWTHPHCMDHMSWAEIVRLKPEQLEYKLEHGSIAELPSELQQKKKKGEWSW